MNRTSLVAAVGTALLIAAVGAAPGIAQSPEASPVASPVASPGASPAASAVPVTAVVTAAQVRISCDALTATPQLSTAADVGAGSALLVELCSNPTTGFRWSDPVSSDPTIVSVGGWTFVAPGGKLPGAAGTEQLTLVGLTTGHAVVTASYDQPWDGGQKGAWTLQLDVVVRPVVAVTIDCATFDSAKAAVTTVTAPVGSVVELSVCANATTGFAWTQATTSDPAIAIPGAWLYQAPPQTDPPIAGAPGSQVVTITADAAGTAVIKAHYVRSFEHKKHPARTLKLTITVQ